MSDTNSEEVLARIEKNAREELRVSIGSFRGHRLVSVRIYVPSNEGAHIPTAKGISFNPILLPEVIAALTKAGCCLDEEVRADG